ncbi:hypothetical protein M231_06350 [Tremella mesenterica]|uniref:Cytochrome P450 n=1 Tax=Tremella mesenterica TaxID=5217 RepID=A0A4Q1BEC0_TREME|nr:hypothetical protein M231_06350 [Tremella mesenterica]
MDMKHLGSIGSEIWAKIGQHDWTKEDAWMTVGIGLGTYIFIWFFRYLKVHYRVRGLKKINSAIEVFEAGHRWNLPHIPFLLPAKDFTLKEPWKKYEQAKSDLIAYTQATTPGYAVYSTSNPQVAQKISTNVLTFGKPIHVFRYRAINIFGLQLTSTQSGPEHRRHRNVVKGCFGEEVMMTAWDKAVECLGDMYAAEGLEDGGVLDNVRLAMYKLTLLIIGAAGFGVKFPWKVPETHGEILPFYEALHLVEVNITAELLVPLWLLENFPLSSVRRLGKAQRSLVHHFKNMIETRRAVLKAEQEGLNPGEKIKPPSDLLGAIVASQMSVEAEEKLRGGSRQVGLTAEEQVATVWIFILAGHETSGNMLAFTLGYLSVYPEWQEKIFKEIEEACHGAYPTYREVNNMPSILACVFESLRLRDLAMTLPKLAMEDTSIPYTTWDDHGNTTHHIHPIKKGDHIVIDGPAVGHNPFFWRDTQTWDPTRWFGGEGVINKNLSISFSAGQRQCIGKRFAEVEMTAVLASIVKKFKFEPIRKKDETDENLRLRMTDGYEVLTLTPNNFSIKFIKREGV